MKKTRKVKDLYIMDKDKDGIEGCISMVEFSRIFLETVGETVDLTFKHIGKELGKNIK